MRATQFLAASALCLPTFALIGCGRTVHEVGQYSLSDGQSGAAATSASAGSGASTSSGTGGSQREAGSSGGGNAGSTAADASLTHASSDPKCTYTEVPAQRHPLGMYILMDANITLQAGLWELATQGLRLFAGDGRSVGTVVGVRYYGNDCAPDPYDTQPNVTDGPLPQNAVAIENSTKITQLQASEMLPALKGGLSHQGKRAGLYPDTKQIVTMISDGFTQDLWTCAPYLPSNVADAAQAGLQRTPPIETYIVALKLPTPSTGPASIIVDPVLKGLDRFSALDAIAAAGGTHQSINIDPANVPSGTNEALQAVRRQAQPCDWLVPPAVNKDTLGVALQPGTGTGEIPKVANAAACGSTEDGWYFDDPGARAHVVACPATCATLGQDDAHGIALLSGCQPKTR